MNVSPELKKILFIVPYPTGAAPSQRFRFEQYFKFLHENSYQFDVKSFWSEKGWSVLYQEKQMIAKFGALLMGFIRRFYLLFYIYQYHRIFMHREALPIGPPIIEYIVSRIFKKKIIYDFDDAIWLPNTSEQNRLISKLKYHQKVQRICRWSWKISCGNDFLAAFARKFNSQVILNPTTIDTDYHKSDEHRLKNQAVTIGWTGTHSTIKYLEPIHPVLEELVDEFQVKLIIISDTKPDWDFDNYEFIPWDKSHEIEQLDRLDIGIMPLADSEWEKGKCGFKALQYMALEKPAVVSNVGVNTTIIEHGTNGFLCEKTEDWKTYLIQLIKSESLRKALGKNGRQKVMDSYSVLSNSGLFLSLFE